MIWRPEYVFKCFLSTHRSKTCRLNFYFESIWPNDLERVSRGALRTGIIFTKFGVCQLSVPDL